MRVKAENLAGGQLYNLGCARDHAQEAAHMITTVIACGDLEGLKAAEERLVLAISYLEDAEEAG